MFECGDFDTMTALAYAAAANRAEDGRVAVLSDNTAVNDPAANGEALLRAYEFTDDPLFKDAADALTGYLLMFAPRTEDGVLYHNNISKHKGFTPNQMWVEGCYMMPPFLAINNEFTEATKQLGGYYNYLHDENTGLFFHIYDIGSNCFVRQKLWAAGNGYVLLATARMVSEAVRQNLPEQAANLCSAGNELLDSMLKFQNDDGLFYDTLDDPKTFKESTAAAMTAAYIYRGIAEDFVGIEMKKYADKAFTAVTKRINTYGFITGAVNQDTFTEGVSAEAQAFYIIADAWQQKN
jgi:rhamnogalacturonyl hydrolase YesR